MLYPGAMASPSPPEATTPASGDPSPAAGEAYTFSMPDLVLHEPISACCRPEYKGFIIVQCSSSGLYAVRWEPQILSLNTSQQGISGIP